MIIPTKPEKARISIEITSAQLEAGEFTHDIDINNLYENRNYCDYEFALVNGGQNISNAYQLFIDDGVLYATVFFIGNDGSITKVTLTDGEGTITVVDGGSGELPSVTDVDDGKVLTVSSGEWSAENPVTELPAVSDVDDGKVLTVENGEWSAENPPESLPDVTSEDNGKVLTVVSGEWEAVKTIWYGPYYFTNENAYNTQSSTTTFDVRLNKITDLDDGYYELPPDLIQTPPVIRTIDVNFNFNNDGDESVINGVCIPYMYYVDSDIPEEVGWYWNSNFATVHLRKIKDPQAGVTTIPAEGIIVGFLINVELARETNA